MPGAVEAGNKMIANVGTVKMFGKTRSRMARLRASCNAGSNSCTVDTALDWVPGDLVGFAPTATQWEHYEVKTVTSYDPITGLLGLNDTLAFYHFGAASSTATNYQGLDMRGEVVLLSRAITISGDMTQNDWHGQFLTMDTVMFDAQGNQISYQGLTILKNVEFSRMGQLDNFHAAIRFENSNLPSTSTVLSSIDGIAIHSSVGWGISVKGSSNINLKNSDVFAVT
jgi:hypothetical protein